MEVIHRRRSFAEGQALVGELESSGSLRAAFCQQRGLALGTNIVNACMVDGRWEAVLLFRSKWFPQRRGMSTASPGAMVH